MQPAAVLCVPSALRPTRCQPCPRSCSEHCSQLMRPLALFLALFHALPA
jgi:hypothetical protein